MLTFLRKIRRSLIQSGSTTKPASPVGRYLLYGIGEIALVVIGILIALQINNWNEDQKRRGTEINLLFELQDNLTNDLQDIKLNLLEDTETLTSNKVVLYHLENKLAYHDSLSFHYGKLQRSTTFVENTSAFENLKTLGFNLISNDALRKKISNLYSARYHYINEINLNTSNEFIWSHFTPLLLENLHTISILENAVPLNHQNLTGNSTFMETLRWHIGIKEFVINLYQNTENAIMEVLLLIEQELNDERK